MRITNAMMSNRYKINLHTALSDLDYYTNRASTLRKFDKVSEDPVAASKAFRLRRAYYENQDYQTNTSHAENQLLTAETSMKTVNDLVREINSGDKLKAITSTSGIDERKIIASKIRQSMESIVGSINSQYGDKYVFGGSNTSEAPFEVAPDGTFTYRGADVNTGKLVFEDGSITNVGDLKISFGKDNGTTFNGYVVNVINDATNSAQIDVAAKQITVKLSNTATAGDLQDKLQTASINGALTADLTKITVSGDLASKPLRSTTPKVTDKVDLDLLKNEKVFLDLGMGVRVEDGVNVNSQSAFNVAIPGLSFLNCGLDSDGNPQNIYNLLGQIADELEKDTLDFDKVGKLGKSLDKQQVNLLSKITEIGVRTNFLTNSKTRLEDTEYNLSVQINDTEFLDADEAIMDMRLQEYVYNAALKMGSRVIQPSFLDYMR